MIDHRAPRRRGRAVRLLIAALAGGAALATGISPAAAQTRWPNGAKAAVVLTYDDALPSQIDTVLPELAEHELTGTFFLSGVKQEDFPRWRAAAAAGNELANHTINHPCSAATYPADPRFTSEAYTPETMLREIAQQNALLSALDGKTEHGFATPCGQTMAGGKDYLEPLRASGLVTYTRGVSYGPEDARADVSRSDPMHVPARGFDEKATGAALIDLAQQAQAGGGWAVYLFHGIGKDYAAVPVAAHRQLLDWLVAHRGEVWVTTLGEALAWAKAHPGKSAPARDGK